MLPGFTFTLENHYRKGVNQSYLITDIDHEGNQTGYLLSGIGVGGGGDEENKVNYRNYFTAIPGTVQFRPEAKTEKPKISGTISGMIDAAGSGQYAELDSQGRYKILFPFDLSGRTGGKASNWVRMAQPYVGSDHGMHFPLHKGTEVLITFIDGDPDRPVIAGAVPNPETPSRVNGDNQSKSRLVSASGNEFHMEDAVGSERIILNSPNQQSFIRIGAPNDPPSASSGDYSSDPDNTDYGFNFNTAGQMNITAGTSNELILGESTETVIGLEVCTTLGGTVYIYLLGYLDVRAAESWEYVFKEGKLGGERTHIFAQETTVSAATTAVHGDKNAVHGAEVKTTASKTDVHAEKVDVVASHTVTTADFNKAIAAQNEVIASLQKAVGEANTAIAAETKARGELAEATAQSTKTIGDKVTVLGSEVKTAVEATHSIAVHTQCNAEANKLAGLYSIL